MLLNINDAVSKKGEMQATQDVLTDIMHFCDFSGYSFQELVESAKQQYLIDKAE
jgi:hypothetical protein